MRTRNEVVPWLEKISEQNEPGITLVTGAFVSLEKEIPSQSLRSSKRRPWSGRGFGAAQNAQKSTELENLWQKTFVRN